MTGGDTSIPHMPNKKIKKFLSNKQSEIDSNVWNPNTSTWVKI